MYTCRSMSGCCVGLLLGWCVLPVVPHYPAVLCSSSGGRRLWIPLSASEVRLHPLLVAAEQHHHHHHHLSVCSLLYIFILKQLVPCILLGTTHQ